MDLKRLRLETAADHEAVEGTVPLMVEDLSREAYVACLLRMHGVVAAWEEWALRHASPWLWPTLVARRRQPLLERDLAWFGQTDFTEARPQLPLGAGEASLLGAMYVMEGSTLGGQLIARHVERVLHLAPGLGDAYFRGHGEETGSRWREFCEILRTRVPENETEAVVHASKQMFQVFGSWMNSPPLPVQAASCIN